MRGAIGRAIRRWRLFEQIRPGQRFKDRYHHRRHKQGRSPKYGRVFYTVGGLALLMAGFVLSWIAVAVGLWMLAAEWLPLARLFDQAEVRLRELGRWVKGRWGGAPAAAKVLVMLACVAALGYGAYYLLFGG